MSGFQNYLLGALVMAVCMDDPDLGRKDRITAAFVWPVVVVVAAAAAVWVYNHPKSGK